MPYDEKAAYEDYAEKKNSTVAQVVGSLDAMVDSVCETQKRLEEAFKIVCRDDPHTLVTSMADVVERNVLDESFLTKKLRDLHTRLQKCEQDMQALINRSEV